MYSHHCYSSFRTGICSRSYLKGINFFWRIILETYNVSTLQLSLSLGDILVSCDRALQYVAGLREQFYNTYELHYVQMYHKPANTLQSVVVHLKDRILKEHQCRTIYHVTCDNDSSHIHW